MTDEVRSTTLGEVCRTYSGGTPSRSNALFFQGTIPWIKSGEVNQRFVRCTEEKISEEALSSSSAKMVSPETILIALYGATAGKVGVSRIEAAINQAILAVVPDTKVVDPAYCFYACDHAMQQTIRHVQGGQPNLNAEIVRAARLFLPSKPQQHKIAEILTCWDKAIELVERLIEEKTRLAKGLARDLLLGKKRLRQFSKPWVESPIGDLLEPIDRYVDWDDEATYNPVSIRRRAGGMFMRESLKGVDILTKTLKTTCGGDFVIARMQAVHGAMAITPPDFHGAHVSDSYVTCISKDPNRLKTEFFGYLATLPQLWNIALLSSHGVSIEKMTFDLRTFFKHKVRLPTDIAEQSAIIQFLDVMNKELAALTSLRDHLVQQKRGLMQQLLTGKKRVALEN